MAKVGILSIGVVFLIITIIGFILPVDDGFTLPQTVGLCNSEMGQFSQGFSGEIEKACSEYNTFLMGIYGSGVLGLILIIVGAVIPSKSKGNRRN